jgi:SAM-dependent methyltransferase
MKLPIKHHSSFESAVFPGIDYEIADLRERGFLSGDVLNVGCGWRDLAQYIPGSLVNQDLSWPGDTRKNVSIYSELHSLPVPNNSFDAVVCLAVLEHVPNPESCLAEIFRVLKPGGMLLASVPFMQPEHKVPGDFQRYTEDGLIKIVTDSGFKVDECRALFSVYQTLYWVVQEWLLLKSNLFYKIGRRTLLPFLKWRAVNSMTFSSKIASAFRVVAFKPA